MLQMDGEPYTDPLNFDRYSPSRFIANWKSPALIIHGERDYRVPVSEGLALFGALQYHGVKSELLMFPDENHWILKPNNSIVWYQTVFSFLSRH
jgi:dipeptidyl aminopeptidase/acylaminoacyl peptidase